MQSTGATRVSLALAAPLFMCASLTLAAAVIRVADAQSPPPRATQAREAHARGLKFRDAGQNAEALAEFKKAVELDPNYAYPWLAIGMLSEKTGDSATAAAAFNKALETRRLPGELRKYAEGRLAKLPAAPSTSNPAATSPAANTVPTGPGGVSRPSAPDTASGCQNTLAHIASRLPTFAEPQLAALRAQMLATTMDQIEGNIRAQGLPLANAAAMTLEQSKEYVNVMNESATCAARAFDGSEADLRRVLDARAYDQPVPTRMGSPMTLRQMIESGGANPNLFVSCLRAFAAADMGKIATDESAVQLTCRAAIRR